MSVKLWKRVDIELQNLQGIMTVAPEMSDFFKLICRVARTDASVLIRGETGTGKELAAQALHRLSPRRDGPWQAINCATLTSELLASELFGHVKGAFTGAISARQGLFAMANNGSLFLDEVAEISLENQARLLRVLQERMFVPVGATQPISSDVRFISATNKGLREEVERGRFREDLMYRIRVVKLFLPRLIDRTGDIEALTWHFMDEFNQQGFRKIENIARETMEAMLEYEWPGNIRELRNVLEGAFAMGEGEILQLADLPPEITGIDEYKARNTYTEKDLERERILNALEECQGKKANTAAKLGLSRATLWRKMREHRINK